MIETPTPTTLDDYFALSNIFNDTLAKLNEAKVTGDDTTKPDTKLLEIHEACSDLSYILLRIFS